MLDFPAHHFLELLSHLDGAVVLVLRDPPGVQKLLHLFLRVSAEVLPELLELLKHSVDPTVMVILHLVVQRIHGSPLSDVS